MDSLHSFIDEMLTEQISKESFLTDLLNRLETQPIPTMEEARTGFATKSSLHGISYDYDKQRVTLSYLVVPNMYEPYTLSFSQFAVVVEGLLSCRRKKRWTVTA